jgi:hypothetical protein
MGSLQGRPTADGPPCDTSRSLSRPLRGSIGPRPRRVVSVSANVVVEIQKEESRNPYEFDQRRDRTCLDRVLFNATGERWTL